MFLAFLLLAGVGANALLKLYKLKSLPSGHYHVFFIEGDTWWHIAVGERILSTHAWPKSDSYSFTAQGNEWISSQWLGDVVMALAMRLGGLVALMVLFIALAGAIMLLAYYYAYLRCGNAKAAFLSCATLFPLASLSFSLRPQLFGYTFLLITLIVLERFRQSEVGVRLAVPSGTSDTQNRVGQALPLHISGMRRHDRSGRSLKEAWRGSSGLL